MDDAVIVAVTLFFAALVTLLGGVMGVVVERFVSPALRERSRLREEQARRRREQVEARRRPPIRGPGPVATRRTPPGGPAVGPLLGVNAFGELEELSGAARGTSSEQSSSPQMNSYGELEGE